MFLEAPVARLPHACREAGIDYGTRMLAGLYKKEGSWKDALFRYGPMDVGYYYADIVLKIWEEYSN